MRRRAFVIALALAAVPAIAWAERSVSQHRVAVVSSASPVQQISEDGVGGWRPFFKELRRLGYIEGQNLIVERYSAEGDRERYADLARQVVARAPEVIIVATVPLARAFAAATDTVPIVAGLGGDPVAMGLVASLARPGRNLTGVSNEAGFDVYGKRLQILKEAMPSAIKIGSLGVRHDWDSPGGQYMLATARQLGITLVGMEARDAVASQFERVFAEMGQNRPDALLISAVGDVYAFRDLIVQLAEKYRLPAMYAYRDYVELGGLMAYANDLNAQFSRMADYSVQILNGAKPSEMPIYQATKFEFVINLKTAKALGLTIPPSILAQADEVMD